MKKISVKFLLLVFLSGFAQLGLLRSVLSQDVFDSYKSNISWINERVHLDNFAIELRKSPEMVGYIAFYTNEKTSLKKIKARINRARRYLINYRKVEEKRIVIIYAGDGPSRVVLQPLDKNEPRPNFGSSKN